jgi:hypothetical protein
MEGWRDGEERENMRDAVGGGGSAGLFMKAPSDKKWAFGSSRFAFA